MKAFEIINEPKKWLQGLFAADAHGAAHDITSPHAVCFCADGAIRRKYGVDMMSDLPQEGRLDFERLHKHLCEIDVVYEIQTAEGACMKWNDTSEYTEVYSTLKMLNI